ncbi:hypothetical protein F5Y05DRAFT_191826 [Hypoxylon sp. FL0543]|nr:hypothetical protein F5Y05DRAFT_191826 [Hypoxylon sp. FL0543]
MSTSVSAAAMASSLRLAVETAGFPPIDSSADALPSRAVRAAVLSYIAAKIKALMAARHEMDLDYTATKYRAIVYPLAPDTDFDFPSLPTLIKPDAHSFAKSSWSNGSSVSTSQQDASISPSFGAEKVPPGVPTALDVVKSQYDIPSSIMTHMTTEKGYVMRCLAGRPARNIPQYNKMYASCRKEFNGDRPMNVKAALLQVSGTRKGHNARCQNCKDGKGLWDKCVVATLGTGYDFSGACANCYYNSKGKTCSFFAGKSHNNSSIATYRGDYSLLAM